MGRPSAAAGALAPPPIPALTGLRFVAALLVFVSHYPVPGVAGTPLRMMRSGYMAVTLFFVLSGFVLAYNYLERMETRLTPGVVGEFLLARVARIYPLYAVLIVFAWLLSSPPRVPLWPYLLAIQTWYPDVRFAFGLVEPSWSIGVEVFLYLAFPLLVPALAHLRVLRSERRIALAALVVCAAMLGAAAWFTVTGRAELSSLDPASAHRWLYRTPVARLGDFLLGMLGAAYCLRLAPADPTTRSRWRVAAPAAIVVTLIFMALPWVFYSAFSWDVAYALPAAVIFVGLTLDPRARLARILGARPMRLLGEASYAFYLIHMLAGRWYVASNPGGVAGLARYGAFLAFVVGCAIAIHLAFERPARRLIRSIFRIPRPAVAGVRAAMP